MKQILQIVNVSTSLIFLFIIGMIFMHDPLSTMISGATTQQTINAEYIIPKESLKDELQKLRPKNIETFNTFPPPDGLLVSDWLGEYKILDEVNGGVWFHPENIGVPPCDESVRGLLWFSIPKDGSADKLLICLKDVSGKIYWQQLTP